MMISTPSISEPESRVIGEIDEIWRRLGYLGQSHRQWSGLLRRTAFARAVRGSNSIEGYLVSIDDAIAAAEDDEPFEAKGEAWEAVRCYRDAMTYVLRLVEDPHFSYSAALIRSLHYMMLKYAQAKSPGLWRQPCRIIASELATPRRSLSSPPYRRLDQGVSNCRRCPLLTVA